MSGNEEEVLIKCVSGWPADRKVSSRTLLLERGNDDNNFLEMADRPIGCVL